MCLFAQVESRKNFENDIHIIIMLFCFRCCIESLKYTLSLFERHNDANDNNMSFANAPKFPPLYESTVIQDHTSK